MLALTVEATEYEECSEFPYISSLKCQKPFLPPNFYKRLQKRYDFKSQGVFLITYNVSKICIQFHVCTFFIMV